MNKVLTFGVFDYFHYGHLRLLERCKQLGDYLIVAVQDGDYIKINKPDADIFYGTQQRVDMLKALKCVDEVVVYTRVEEYIKKIRFDIFVVGGDQTNSSIQKAIEWCNKNGKEIVYLERTPNVCSSQIKNILKKEN